MRDGLSGLAWSRLAAGPAPGLLVGLVTGMGWVAENWFGSSNSLPLFYFLFPISNTTQT